LYKEIGLALLFYEIIGNIAGKIPKFYRKIVETSQKKDTRNTAHFAGLVQANELDLWA
jgi:hypothetical protein